MSDKEYKNNTDELPAVLGSMKYRKEGFAVPTGYFEHLADNLIVQVAAAQPSKATHTIRRRVGATSNWYAGMAAAAILVGVVLASWLFVTTRNEAVVPPLAEVEAAVTPQEVHEYVLNHLDEFEEDLLGGTSTTNPSADPSTWDIPEEELNDFLEQLDENDLNEWL